MSTKRGPLGILVAISLTCAACGSTDSGLTVTAAYTDDSSAVDSTAPTGSVGDATTTSGPATTVPANTAAPATTVPTSIVPTTTTIEAATTVPAPTVPTVPAGWVAAEFGLELYAPHDESNFIGVPSPALPADPNSPLADGIYQADTTRSWSPALPASVDITVHRLEACSLLGEDVCVNYGDPFQADEMGIDESSSLELSLPLDQSIGVGVTGSDCEGVVKSGNGADLLDLFTSFDQAYAIAVVPMLDAGTDQFEILKSLTMTPVQGFSGHSAECSYEGIYEVVFHSGDAPPLLLQTLAATEYDSNGSAVGTRPLAPTDVLILDIIEVKGGVTSLYFYAGFYS